MAEPEIRRRRRPAVSCTLCRRRKIRCNREQPCSNCLRARTNVVCVYEELPPPPATSGRPAQPSNTAPQAQRVSTAISATKSPGLVPPRGNGSLAGAGIVIRGPSAPACHRQSRAAVNGASHDPREASIVAPGDSSQRSCTSASTNASADQTSAGTDIGTDQPDHHYTDPPPQPQPQRGVRQQTQQQKQKQTGKDVQSLQQRIRQLERQLQENHAIANPSPAAIRAGFPVAASEDSQITPVSYITLSDPPMHTATTRHARRSRSRPSRSASPAQGRQRRHTRSRSPPRQHPVGLPPAQTRSATNSHGSSRKKMSGYPQAVGWPARPRSIAGDFYVSTARPRDGRWATKSTVGSTKRSKGVGKGNKGDKGDKGDKGISESKSQDPSASYPRRHMHMTSRSVMHKTRLFGQSHWVNSIVGFRDIFEMIDPLVSEEHNTLACQVFVDMQRLKHLGRVIKAQRIGPTAGTQWAPTSLGIGIPIHLHHINPDVQPIRRPHDLDLPPRALADELVTCYLRSTESMYRILHVPMFRREYEALWQSFAAASSSSSSTPGIAFAKSDSAFVAQLRLVLAIGASTHADHIGLRARAVRWFYAAQAWHAEPEYKAHLTMQTLQIHVLLLFAREAVGIGGALIWITVGDLVRSAVYMGLHRDPSNLPKRMSLLAAEMRRRLWNTILELVVATSMDAGGPVMLSLSDFDARPPENLDDDALEEASLVAMPPPANFLCPRGGVPTCIATAGCGSKPDGGGPAAETGVPKSVYISDGEMRGVPPYETATEMIEAEISEGVWKATEEGGTLQQNPAVSGLNIRVEERDDEDEENEDEGDDGEHSSDDDGSDASPETSTTSTPFTQTSVAIALRRTWSLRLLICKFVNSMGPPGSYAGALHLDRRFREAYRGLCATMQQYSATASDSDGDSDDDQKVSPFVLSSVDLLMRRYMLCLHIPFFGAARQDEPAYAYSRRVVVDTALRIWHTACPGVVDAAVATQDAAGADDAHDAHAVAPALVRQSMLGSGPLRRLTMQASLLVAAEIKLQLLEDEGILGAPARHRAAIRPDLLAVLEAAAHWCLRSIEAGETNFKGYLLWRLILGQLDGMRRGLMGAAVAASAAATGESRMALARELVQAAAEAEAECMPIMEGMVTRGYQEMGLLGAGPGASPTLRSSAAADAPAWTHSEVHALARSCRMEDCPCQAPYREQQQRRAREEQQHAYEQMQAQVQNQVQSQVPLPFSALPFTNMANPVAGGPQALDPMDLTVDNWEFLMPDPTALGMGLGEPTSWLLTGDAANGILW